VRAQAGAAWLLGRGATPQLAPGAAQPGLAETARRHRDFPLLNTPHAFLGALQDTVAVALIAAWQGPAAAGFWGLALRYLKAPATLVGGAVSQALYPLLAAGGAASEAGRSAVRRVLGTLLLLAVPLVLGCGWAPSGLAAAFGERWRGSNGALGCTSACTSSHAAVGGDHGLGRAGLGAEAVAGGPGAVRRRAGRGAGLGGLKRRAGRCRRDDRVFGWFFWKLATWPVPAASAPGTTRLRAAQPAAAAHRPGAAVSGVLRRILG
jgi:hypothetical protein